MATPTGERAIGSLKVGNTVEAYNPATGHSEPQTIQHVWLNHDHDLVDVTLHTDTAPSQDAATDKAQRAAVKAHGSQAPPDETLHTTANHPWLTADRGWVPAGLLRPGEPVVTLGGGTATVAAVRVVPGEADYYNLTVSQDHTYAVGEDRAVVHNTEGPCGGDINNSPQQYAHERAQELQAALPEGTRGRVTMGVGIVEDPETGARSVMIGTSENYLRQPVTGLLSLQELGDTATGNLHAERNILDAATFRGQRVIAVGAGRPICEECQAAIKAQGGESAIASYTRTGFVPFWMRRP